MYESLSDHVEYFEGTETTVLRSLGQNAKLAMRANGGLSYKTDRRINEELRLKWIEPSQEYDRYSENDHEAWRRLLARMASRWERYAPEHFKRGLTVLNLDPT